MTFIDHFDLLLFAFYLLEKYKKQLVNIIFLEQKKFSVHGNHRRDRKEKELQLK